MQNFQPLTDAEMEAVRKVQDIFRFMHRIACTACRCCTDGCPQHLPIRERLEQVAAELKKKEEPETGRKARRSAGKLRRILLAFCEFQ